MILGSLRTATLRTSALPHPATRFPKLQATMATYERLVRFVPKSGGQPLVGEPVSRDQDVGLATYAGEPVEVEVFEGRSVLQPGERTGRREQVERLLSPLAASEVGTIRCIGLNVRAAAASGSSHSRRRS